MMQKLSGFTPFAVTLLSAIPFIATWPFMLLVGWNSDRTGERRWHTAGCSDSGGSGVGVGTRDGQYPDRDSRVYDCRDGNQWTAASFWALPNQFLAGTSAAAVIGSINCVGNTGGFVGPYFVGWLTDKTGTYAAGVFYLIGSALMSAALVLLVKPRKVVAT